MPHGRHTRNIPTGTGERSTVNYRCSKNPCSYLAVLAVDTFFAAWEPTIAPRQGAFLRQCNTFRRKICRHSQKHRLALASRVRRGYRCYQADWHLCVTSQKFLHITLRCEGAYTKYTKPERWCYTRMEEEEKSPRITRINVDKWAFYVQISDNPYLFA